MIGFEFGFQCAPNRTSRTTEITNSRAPNISQCSPPRLKLNEPCTIYTCLQSLNLILSFLLLPTARALTSRWRAASVPDCTAHICISWSPQPSGTLYSTLFPSTERGCKIGRRGCARKSMVRQRVRAGPSPTGVGSSTAGAGGRCWHVGKRRERQPSRSKQREEAAATPAAIIEESSNVCHLLLL